MAEKKNVLSDSLLKQQVLTIISIALSIAVIAFGTTFLVTIASQFEKVFEFLLIMSLAIFIMFLGTTFGVEKVLKRDKYKPFPQLGICLNALITTGLLIFFLVRYKDVLYLTFFY